MKALRVAVLFLGILWAGCSSSPDEEMSRPIYIHGFVHIDYKYMDELKNLEYGAPSLRGQYSGEWPDSRYMCENCAVVNPGCFHDPACGKQSAVK